jgi:hypothetical protein
METGIERSTRANGKVSSKDNLRLKVPFQELVSGRCLCPMSRIPGVGRDMSWRASGAVEGFWCQGACLGVVPGSLPPQPLNVASLCASRLARQISGQHPHGLSALRRSHQDTSRNGFRNHGDLGRPGRG